jgi:hypothetical protein
MIHSTLYKLAAFTPRQTCLIRGSNSVQAVTELVTERKEQVYETLQKINPGQVGRDSAGNADVV